MPSLSPNSTKWNDRLAFDVALCLENSGSLDEALTYHEKSADDMIGLSKDATFLRRVRDYRDEIRDKGLSFRLKARAQAEELLETSYMLIHDKSVAASVKADLIKSTVKWAGLEPRKDDDDPGGGAGGVKITINLGSSPRDERVIDATPRTLEYHDIEHG